MKAAVLRAASSGRNVPCPRRPREVVLRVLAARVRHDKRIFCYGQKNSFRRPVRDTNRRDCLPGASVSPEIAMWHRVVVPGGWLRSASTPAKAKYISANSFTALGTITAGRIRRVRSRFGRAVASNHPGSPSMPWSAPLCEPLPAA